MTAASGAVSTPSSRLSRYHWQIKTATGTNGQPIDALLARPKGPLQLDFSHGRISIKHVCNAMSGSYRIAHGELHVASMLHTMMACSNHSLNQLEGAITRRLRVPAHLQINTGGGMPRLILVTADGDTLTFAGRPKSATR